MAHSVQMGFLLAGTVGTGIALAKLPDGSWSGPCALGLSQLGFGILVGASTKDIVIFVMDNVSMDALTSKHGLKLGSQLEVTTLIGRAGKSDMTFTKQGVGATFAIAYSKGAFLGLSIEGAVVGAREFVNNLFYSTVADPKDILDGKVSVPPSKLSSTMLKEVYEKLNKLEQGVTAEPTAEEKAKESVAKEAADKEAESIKDSPEVVQVDAAAEAAKEASA
jgi:lipid-binding SYLF domain-containing protein